MIDDNQTNDSCDANINEVAKRKMKVWFEVFDNQSNELKVHEEYKQFSKHLIIAVHFVEQWLVYE